MKIDHIINAFNLGLKFYRGMCLLAQDRAQSEIATKLNNEKDGEHWVTVNAENGNGQHVLLSGEGRVLAGMGGKFTGVKIDNIPRKKFINERAWQRKEQANKKTMNYTLPAKVHPEHIQNRDRSGEASREQIIAIAKDPDYDRLSASRTLADGAPVVAYGKIPAANLGHIVRATDAKGKKINVQYAVVDAADVAASHNYSGDRNDKFYSDDPNVTRAIAGNGRIAAMQRAYKQGTAGDYKDALIDDPTHGIDIESIVKIKNPVLVRVMQPGDVTADIGDRSNTAGGMNLSAMEQAQNDTKRIDLKGIETYADGSPTPAAVSAFIDQMPESERGNLRDADGYPTRQAQERLKAAMFAKAYNSEPLLHIASQAASMEQARIVKGLQGAAARVADIAESNPEIRDLIAGAAERAIGEARTMGNIADIGIERDMFKTEESDAAERAITKIFKATSAREITGKLNAVAKALKAEADRPEFDLFGAVEKRPAAEVIAEALKRYES